MAGPKKTKRQLADEAFLRNEQIRIDDSPPVAPKEYPALEGVPKNCPECGRTWDHLGGLNPLHHSNERQSSFLEQAQCVKCGNIFLISPDDHERIVTARAEHTAAKHAAKKAEEQAIAEKKANRITKGAG